MGLGDPQRLMADISDYQEHFDPRKYRRAGHAAIMIKAAEGLGVAGAILHRRRANEAHAEGLRVVHYAYLHGFSGEGAHLVSRVADVWKDGDVLCADAEIPSANRLQLWRTELRDAGHKEPIGYSGQSFLNERAAWASLLGAGWIIADYGTLKIPNLADRRAARTQCLGRQYTDGVNGAGPRACAGIGACDITWLTNAGIKRILEHR